MPKTKQKKEEIVKQLTDKIKEAQGVVFSSYMGLDVSSMEDLRKKLREENTELTVTKKTLLKKALADSDLDVNVDAMEGGIILITGSNEIQPAKILKEFSKKHDSVEFFGGIMEGKFIDVEKVKYLADLPGKEELLAKMVGSLNAPVNGFVNVLAGNLRGLVNVLDAIKEQKQ